MKSTLLISGMYFIGLAGLSAGSNVSETAPGAHDPDADSTIIYTVEYGPKPLSAPELKPVYRAGRRSVSVPAISFCRWRPAVTM